MDDTCEVEVSVIVPVYNARKWIIECLRSVEEQDFDGSLELSIYDDGSKDDTLALIKDWMLTRKDGNRIFVVVNGHHESSPKGVGFAKNCAVKQSRGKYLCFLDADDVMKPTRVRRQWETAIRHPNSIVGCRFERIPPSSTARFTAWANGLTPEQLHVQIYLSHGPTLAMPTWFCSRAVFHCVGGFSEAGKGIPEDLIFFYAHLDLGGGLFRLDECLLLYRHHPEATTATVLEDTIWKLRLGRFQRDVLPKWSTFTIWNAGKQGRRFYRCLESNLKKKVVAFCDVDSKKIAKGEYVFEKCREWPKPRIPIIHFSKARPPFVLCVKLGLTKGEFEANLNSLNLIEGKDYYHFN